MYDDVFGMMFQANINPFIFRSL